MKRLLSIFSLLLAGMLAPVYAQAPDVQIAFGPWTDTAMTPIYNNITTQATYWVVNYQVTGFSAISIEFDSATGVSAPGAFGLFSGTVTTGSNPSTSVSCSTPTNCTAVFTGSVGFARVAFTSHTGIGTIRGTLQGYKTGYALGGNMTGGSGCPTPCPVKGVDSSGSPPTVAPVPAAGFDGTNIQPIKTDTGGNLQTAPIGAAAFTTNQVAVTGTAAMIDAGTAARAVCVEALAANTINVYVGGAGVTISTGLELQPGQSTCQPVNNTNLVYVVASTTGAGVAWSLVN